MEEDFDEEFPKHPELRNIGKKILREEGDALSDIENFAYVLGDLPSGESSLAFVQDLLSYFQGWDNLFAATPEKLMEFEGMNETVAEVIAAVGESEEESSKSAKENANFRKLLEGIYFERIPSRIPRIFG